MSRTPAVKMIYGLQRCLLANYIWWSYPPQSSQCKLVLRILQNPARDITANYLFEIMECAFVSYFALMEGKMELQWLDRQGIRDQAKSDSVELQGTVTRELKRALVTICRSRHLIIRCTRDNQEDAVWYMYNLLKPCGEG